MNICKGCNNEYDPDDVDGNDSYCLECSEQCTGCERFFEPGTLQSCDGEEYCEDCWDRYAKSTEDYWHNEFNRSSDEFSDE